MRTTTTQAAYRRLDQPTKTGDRKHEKPQSFDTKLMHPGVSKSLTRSVRNPLEMRFIDRCKTFPPNSKRSTIL